MEYTMTTRTIVLSPDALLFVEQEALRGLVEAAGVLADLDQKKEPAGYATASARVRAGVLALADIWNSEEARPLHEEYSMDRPPGGDLHGLRGHNWPLKHSFQELRAMEDAGLEPMKELGPHDPRASRPRCIHGKYFSEECPDCEKPMFMQRQSEEQREAAARCNCEPIGQLHEPMCASLVAPQ
jgi:hypothetical protein